MLEPSSYHKLWKSSRSTRRPNASSRLPAIVTKTPTLSVDARRRTPDALSMVLDVVQDPVDELVRGHRLQLFAGSQPYADRARLLIPAAGYHHVRHLLGLRLGDLALHLLVAIVQRGPDAQVQQPLVQRAEVGNVLIGYRDELRLHRRKPCGERASVFLDQEGHHALQRADDAAVDHHRLVGFGVLAYVLQLELVG